MLVFWGDSIWAGPPECGYVPQMLTGLVDAHVVPMAVGGATSGETVARMEANPALCAGLGIISMGRCNLWEPDKIIEDWIRASQLIETWFAVPLPKTSLRGTEKFAAYEAIDNQVRELAGDRFLDFHAYLGARSGMVPASLMHDPVHCNRAGNLLAAEFIATELVRRNFAPKRITQAA